VARAAVGRGGRVVYVDHDPQRLAEDATAAYVLRDGMLFQASAVDFAVPLVVIDLEDARSPGRAPAGPAARRRRAADHGRAGRLGPAAARDPLHAPEDPRALGAHRGRQAAQPEADL